MAKNSSKYKFVKKFHFLRVVKIFTLPLLILLDKTKTLKFFAKAINAILKLFKIKKEFNTELNYRVFSKIFKKAFKPSENETLPFVLFAFYVGTENTFNLREMMLAKYLENKGHPIKFFICDGFFKTTCPIERDGKTKKNTILMCHECSNNYKYYQKETNIPIHYLSQYAKHLDKAKIDSQYEAINSFNTIEECKNFSIESNVPIGALAYVSVLRYFHKGSLSESKNEIDTYKSILKSATTTYYLYSHIFNANKIIKVVLWNGTSFYDRIIAYLAQSKGIDYITQETYVGTNSWIFKKNGIAIHLDYTKEFNNFKSNNKFTQEQKTKITDLYNGFRVGKMLDIKLNNEEAKLSLNKSQRYAVLFTNLNFDTYVLGRNPFYKDMKDWIVKTINFWNDNVEGVKLIVRVHPGESKIMTPSKDFVSEVITPLLTDKIIFYDSTDDVNSYHLLELAEYVLVYSSTIGAEAMLMDIPCVAQGEPFYSDYCIYPKDQTEYHKTINDLNNKIFKHQINKDDLLYYLYYSYFIRNREIEGFKFDRIKGKAILNKNENYNELIHKNETILNEVYSELF